MSVVRNIVLMVTVTTAVVASFGLFGALVIQPPTPPPVTTPPAQTGGIGPGTVNSTTPVLPFGAQVAFGTPNNVKPRTSNNTPNIPSDSLGGVQSGSNSLFATDYSANYAAKSAVLLQQFIQSKLTNLAYDPILGQAAANLIADTLATGQANVTQSSAVNSTGQTPIQQVIALSPSSTATSVSVLTYVSDALVSTGEATNPATGLAPAQTAFLGDPLFANAGWTHFGLAVVTVPTVANQYNARRYYIIFFAKE